MRSSLGVPVRSCRLCKLFIGRNTSLCFGQKKAIALLFDTKAMHADGGLQGPAEKEIHHVWITSGSILSFSAKKGRRWSS